jgi:hypothetical protein
MDTENTIKHTVEEHPNPKRRAYKRQRLKKQYTVRIDEDLSKAVIVRAQAEGLRLTDAMEEGLWLWLQRKQVSHTALRGRFLWNVIPLRLQRLTLGFWGYISQPRSSATEEIFRKTVEEMMWSFRQDPECAARLEQLGSLPQPEDAEEGAR